MPHVARRHPHHSAVLAVAMLLAVAALGSRPGSTAAADLTVSAAEQQVVALLNTERQKAGLVALRVDPRLASIARARSADMAAKGYFSHTQPDGRTVGDYLAAGGITWYAYAEIIALNSLPNLAGSAVQARDSWMGSAPHRSIILSGSYNYFGIGLALDPATGKRLWTGVFIKGPDRTGGWVAYAPVVESTATLAGTVSYRTVTISWQGDDIRLQVLTSGFLHFQTQVRTDADPWKWLSTATTTRSLSLRLWQGHGYTVRARACDRAGNCGYWSNLSLEG